MKIQEFRNLLMKLADAWNAADPYESLSFFTHDGVFMQPPGIHIFRGYDQLRILFESLKPGTNFSWHSIWFDEGTQTGAGEFTFRINEAHGVAAIELDDGKIKMWREYQWESHLSWEQFISTDRSFRMTIGNFKPE
jgi:hypothetical protein